MRSRIDIGSYAVAEDLFNFVRNEALPGAGIEEEDFWAGCGKLLASSTPRVNELLERRSELQAQLDAHHPAAPASGEDLEAYQAFLRAIGYLAEDPGDVHISTSAVDLEVSSQPGPQLVVPLTNARFAINAANARWGSLYDALYGSDVIAETDGRERGAAYNVRRGQEVIAFGRSFLDTHFPLTRGSHHAVLGYVVGDDGLVARLPETEAGLVNPSQLVGLAGDPTAPSGILLVHHGLHVEIRIDRDHAVGATDSAGVSDIVMEAAVTAIMDLEDSVAAVSSADKIVGYRNWLGLMKRTLTAEVDKDGRVFTRRLHADRTYTTAAGDTVSLPGTALMFVRHVGHHMFSDAIVDQDGSPVPEGVLDALITGLCSLVDLRVGQSGGNSRTGAMYVVKPKMHGPDEVALACEIFAGVESVLGLPPRTIKIGLMDEERRTSANLKACIAAAQDRVAFINTGFLDRTGDEIRTSTYAGPMVPKTEMKSQAWMQAYEDQNVDIGLATGFLGRAQIGKGMWAAPDNLAQMLEEKVAHPMAGATCAWVPSPTAATLHAIHYHQVDVLARQREIAGGPPRGTLRDLLTIPTARGRSWTDDEVRSELDNNVQSTLGYVVRWVNDGVGCSKVPDIAGTALMEDRATCRISSQLVSNWLLHGVVTLEQVEESLRRMAVIVDVQNASELGYRAMGPLFDGHAFAAARELLINGTAQPSGYTEFILHRHRLAQLAIGAGR